MRKNANALICFLKYNSASGQVVTSKLTIMNFLVHFELSGFADGSPQITLLCVADHNSQ